MVRRAVLAAGAVVETHLRAVLVTLQAHHQVKAILAVMDMQTQIMVLAVAVVRAQ